MCDSFDEIESFYIVFTFLPSIFDSAMCHALFRRNFKYLLNVFFSCLKIK